MLHSDALREVLLFMHSFERSGLLLANRHLFRVASQMPENVERVQALKIFCRARDEVHFQCQESPSSALEDIIMKGRANVEWATACAFHGCFVERIYIDSRYGFLPKLPHNVAAKQLHLFLGGGEHAEEVIAFLSRIHIVEEVVLESRSVPWNANVEKTVAAYCRKKGIGRFEAYRDLDLPPVIPRFMPSGKK